MPKTLTNAVETAIATPVGLEPLFIIELMNRFYADRAYGTAENRLISISGITSSVKLSQGGTVNEVTITLDDNDGALKRLIDTTDLHKQRVNIYQAFGSLDIADKALIYTGQINTPISYSDVPRQLSFRVVSTVEDLEVGFSPEQHAFKHISKDAIGKAWPLTFGSPLLFPAVKVTENTRGSSRTRYQVLIYRDVSELYEAASKSAKSTRKKELTDYYLNSLKYWSNRGLLDRYIKSLEGVFATNFLPSDWNAYLSIIGEWMGDATALNRKAGEKIKKSPTQKNNIVIYITLVFKLVYMDIIRNELIFIRDYLIEQIVNLNLAILENGKALNNIGQLIVLAGKDIHDTKVHVDALRAEESLLKSTSPALVAKRNNFLRILHGSESLDYGDDNLTQDDSVKQQLAEKWATTSNDLLLAISENKTIVPGNGGVLGQIFNLGVLEVLQQNLVYTYFLFLLQFTQDHLIVEDGEKFPHELDNKGKPVEYDLVVNNLRFRGVWHDGTANRFDILQNMLPTHENLELDTTQVPTSPYEFFLKDGVSLKGLYCLMHIVQDGLEIERILFIQEQEGKKCTYYNLIASPQKFDNIKDNSVTPGETGIVIDSRSYVKETCPLVPDRWIKGLAIKEAGKSGDIDNVVAGFDIDGGNDWKMDIGDTVYLKDDVKDIYIVSLNPIEDIKEVAAYRTTPEKGKILVPIPSSYYDKNLEYVIIPATEDQAEVKVAVLIFTRPLKEYTEENWEDTVYVSVKSSVGSNTADQIKYLVDTYSTYDMDTTTYNAAKTRLDKYPSHFALSERGNVIEVIEKIAWQARCAIYVSNGKVYIRYLSYEVDETDDITLDDVIADNSLSIGYSETEDLVTRFTALWKPHGAYDDNFKIILRNNIKRYGLHEKDFEFNIYNIESLVLKSAMFWMLRYSHTWKLLTLTVPLTKLAIEPLDTILLSATGIVASSQVKCIVTDVSYDANTYNIRLTLWCPVVAGTMGTYVFAWPGSASQDTEYPTTVDIDAGGGA